MKHGWLAAPIVVVWVILIVVVISLQRWLVPWLVGAVADDLPDGLQGRIDAEPHGEHRFVVVFRFIAQSAGLGPAPDIQAETLVGLQRLAELADGDLDDDHLRGVAAVEVVLAKGEPTRGEHCLDGIQNGGLARVSGADQTAERCTRRPLQRGRTAEVLSFEVSDLHRSPCGGQVAGRSHSCEPPQEHLAQQRRSTAGTGA